MAGHGGGGGDSHGYPASVEDDETADVSEWSAATSAQLPRSVHDAVEVGGTDDDDDDTPLQLPQQQPYSQQQQQPQEQRYADTRDDAEDRHCLAEMLQQVQLREQAPAELRLPFYHATVVRDQSSLSDGASRKASELVAALRRVSFAAGGHAASTPAAVGLLDPSCCSPNDFLPYATSIPRQFELAYEQSGLLFVCLGEGQADRSTDGWLPLVADDGLAPLPGSRRAGVVFVFLDEATAQSPLLRTRGYRVDALLSGAVHLAAMLEACLPRRSEWLANQERRLQQWRCQRALELLMEERERRHQCELGNHQLLRSLQEQRSAHAAAAVRVTPAHGSGRQQEGRYVAHGSIGGFGGCDTPCRPAPPTIRPLTLSPLGSCSSNAYGSASLMPSAQDLVQWSCTQKPVRHYYGGENWKNLCQLPQSGIILLYGLPGVGKTQTALRFADFISQEKPQVFVYLFHFDTPEAFAADVNLLGEQLSPGTAGSVGSASAPTLHDQFCSLIHVLKSSLYSDVHKVLILDGADANRFSNLLGKTSLLESLLGRRSDFLFLLTATSCQHYEAVHADSFTLLEIEPLSPDEVEQVMRKDSYFAQCSDLPALARRLRTELCGLPLGVFPALAYMRRTRCSVDQYVRRLDDPDVMADLVVRSPTYQRTVRQAVRLAVTDLLDQKRQYSNSRATMVLLAACFARQELPTELLNSCLALRSVQLGTDDEATEDDDGQPCHGAGGCNVDEIVSDLKVTCLFENDGARYMDVPLVTVHKVVHDVMIDILVNDPASQLDEALDLALRGAFVEVEIDTRQRRSREHAILLHPHLLHLTTLAGRHYARLAARPCAKLCLIYLLQAAAYVHLESGDVEAAIAASADAVDRFCELLGTSRDAMLAASERIDPTVGGAGGAGGVGSFGTSCPLVPRLDALARATRMSRLLCRRRAHVTTKEWPDHMTSSDYARATREGSAIGAGRLDAFFPYELLAAALYMHGRALKRTDQVATAGAAYRLCLHLCEHVRHAPGGMPLMYELLAQRSGMRCLWPPPTATAAAANGGGDGGGSLAAVPGVVGGGSEAEWLRVTISRCKQLADVSGEYYQMGLRKQLPRTDDLHQLLCCFETVRYMRRLHQLAATTERCGGGGAAAAASVPSRASAESDLAGARDDDTDSALPAAAAANGRCVVPVATAAPLSEALAIQRESFVHGQKMLELAKEMDASLLGMCFIEHGHLTLQMLAQNGASHAVPYYGCGLAELFKVGMPTRVALAVRQIVDCHLDLGRVPSDDLFSMVTSHLDMLRSNVARHVSEAHACVDALRAVHKLYQVLKADPGTGAQRLNKAFGTVAPQVACRANSTLEEEQAYAWHEAARGIGYSDASIMKECRLLLNERVGEAARPSSSSDGL